MPNGRLVSKLKPRWVLQWLLLFAWTGLIWRLSSQPVVPSVGNAGIDIAWRQGGHLMLHFGLFLLAWLAGVSTLGRTRGTLFALVFALANALLDEIYQVTMPGRNANLEDVLTNGAGVLLGLAVVERCVVHKISCPKDQRQQVPE